MSKIQYGRLAAAGYRLGILSNVAPARALGIPVAWINLKGEAATGSANFLTPMASTINCRI